MAKLYVECIRPYHSYLWPHAKVGDKQWIDDNTMSALVRDVGGGYFSILAVEDDRGTLTKTMPDIKVPVEAKEPEVPQEPPKKKRGRPRKNPA